MAVTPGTPITGTTTIDSLFSALFATRSGTQGPISYSLSDPVTVMGRYADGSYVQAHFEARPLFPDVLSLGAGTTGSLNPAQISVYEDFVVYPGAWGSTGTAPSGITPTGAQNGILSIAPGSILQRQLSKTNGNYSLPFGNISKMVFRVVFLMTSVSLTGFNEITLGFTHTGTSGADGTNNLYGAFINFCPGYGGALPDWNTRAFLTTPQLTGFTYGIYNGSSVSPALAGFGYKGSAKITAPLANTWYEGIISMVPGISCAFYIGPYGAPVLDQTCTVTAQIPNLMTAGPVICVGVDAGVPAAIRVDKCQYGVWVTEGNKALTDDQLFGL